MTTLLKETRITLTALAKRENVNVTTVWRWANRGVKKIKLETFSVGGRRYTTDEAFARWVKATNAADGTPISASDREAAVLLAESACDAAGI